MIDTHAHLYAKAFDGDRQAMLERALGLGVGHFYLPNIDSASIAPMLELEAAYPEHCFAMMGLHPCHVGEGYEAELAMVRHWLDKRPFCAVGEIGLDLHWDTTWFEQQKAAFRTQIEWAIALDRPIVIHSRKSTAEVLEVLGMYDDVRLRGIFHCFGGSAEEAAAIIDRGFLLGIGGVATYPKSGLAEVLAMIGLEHIVLETDAPYLAPVPHRGKRNESSYIPLIAEAVALAKGVSVAEVAAATTANAERVFDGWPA